MTSYDNYANLVINEPIGEVFKKNNIKNEFKRIYILKK